MLKKKKESVMAVKNIVRMGNPLLRQENRKLKKEEIFSPQFKDLINDLRDTMEQLGGIGIAAPQIGENLQVAIINVPKENRYGEETDGDEYIIINPEIKILDSTEQGFWEGCLSVPGLRGYVERPRHIQINYTDIEGKAAALEAEDFLATVFQHELDHLYGIIYIDRIRDPKKLSFEEEFDQFIAASNEEVLD
jgi:peptide deformylase